MSQPTVARLAAAVASVLIAPAAHAQYSFTPIVAPGAAATSVNGVNDAGQVVGSYSVVVNGLGQSFGFLYSNGTYTPLSVPGATNTYGTDVNDVGQIVGYYNAPGLFGTHGFVYSGGEFTLLDVPGAQQTSPFAINDAGQIVGRYIAGNAAHAFLYDHGAFTTLDFDFAADINDLGQIVGNRIDAVTRSARGVLYDHGALTLIVPPGATDTRPNGINDGGQIVGVATVPGLGRYAFVYRGGVFSGLNESGLDGMGVAGINDAGQLIGEYADPRTTFSVGYLATPATATAAPEPATWALVGSGLLGFGLVGRLRRRA